MRWQRLDKKKVAEAFYESFPSESHAELFLGFLRFFFGEQKGDEKKKWLLIVREFLKKAFAEFIVSLSWDFDRVTFDWL